MSDLAPEAGQRLLAGRQFLDGSWRDIEDTVTEECVLTVTWKDELQGAAGESSLFAWARDLDSLAAGHVLMEKIVDDAPRRAEVLQTGQHAFAVSLRSAPAPEQPEPLPPLTPELLFEAMCVFIAVPGQWDATGCFHKAGVFDPRKNALLTVVEDIGRHNCLDRLAGWSNFSGISLADKVLLISARLTGSLCAKALRAGFRVLISRSAITTNALERARDAGAALAGFARTWEKRFTLFTDPLGRVSTQSAGE